MKDAVKALRNGRNTLAVSKLTEILSKSKQSPDDEVDNVAVGSRPSSIVSLCRKYLGTSNTKYEYEI